MDTVLANPFCHFFPYEIVGYLFTFIEIDDLSRLSRTNRENNKLVNSIIQTEYFVHGILTRQFQKKALSTKLRDFMNKITAKHNFHWINMFSSFYLKKGILPQREVMLVWDNYDFLIDAIIFGNIPILNFLFLTYKIDYFFLSTVFERLKYHNKINELNMLINEARNWNIWIDSNYPSRINKYNYGYNLEICDIQLNLYALPFMIGKSNIGFTLLKLLKKRVGYENHRFCMKDVFIVWLPNDYRYIGEISNYSNEVAAF